MKRRPLLVSRWGLVTRWSCVQQRFASSWRPSIRNQQCGVSTANVWAYPKYLLWLRGIHSGSRRNYSIQQEQGHKRNHGQEDETNKKRQLPRGVKAALCLATPVIALLATTQDVLGMNDFFLELVKGPALNTTSFVPFTVVHKEAVSPTAFIITVRPRAGWLASQLGPLARPADPSASGSILPPQLARLLAPSPTSWLGQRHASARVIADAWAHGLWSVEVKQPQIQVARRYTPLPPATPHDEAAAARAGELRFLVRPVPGGEVSSYVAGLRVGDAMELRGPHLGFDVRARLGRARVGAGTAAVVFLAGGTGVAPALQLARALLLPLPPPPPSAPGAAGEDAPPAPRRPAVSVLWANRLRADCMGCEGAAEFAAQSGADQPRGAVVRELARMRDLYGDSLGFRCFADEESTFITESAIRSAVRSLAASTTGHGTTSVGRSSGPTSADCFYHSELALQVSSDDEDHFVHECRCGGDGPGKNLLFVSGPDGFIQAFAGEKKWYNGKERQGPVTGILGDMKAKRGSVLKDWMVLKM